MTTARKSEEGRGGREVGVLRESLKDAVRDRQARARRAEEAYDSLQNKSSVYAREISDLAAVHARAAQVYLDALVALGPTPPAGDGGEGGGDGH